MKIFAVRIGDKYGPEYETYLEKKLSDYEMVWIREPYHSDVQLQWNKMYAMNTGIDEPVCVIDIDMLLINDYKKINVHHTDLKDILEGDFFKDLEEGINGGEKRLQGCYHACGV